MLVVALIVLETHWSALSAQALFFDDEQYVTENPLVQNPSWSNARQFLTEVLQPSTVSGYYQPLTMISLMLDHAAGGNDDNLRPFHRTSLALHVCNTSLVVLLLYMLFRQPWVAALVGLLFGLHPMTVETIPWTSERKTLLAAFFALGCLITYVRYTQTSKRTYYVISLILYVIALMSKPTSTPLPLCMLLLDAWPLRRLRQRAVLEKIPFFIVAGIAACLTVISQGRAATVAMPTDHSPVRILLILCHNIVFYLSKIAWPTNLSSFYAFPEPMSLSHPMVLAGVIGTCVLIPALFLSLRWTLSLLVGWLFFFVAIFPTMGVIGFTIVIASDKYAYLPAVGLLLPLTWGVIQLVSVGTSSRRKCFAIAGVALATTTAALAERHATKQYLECWQDSGTLYQRMLTFTPNAYELHNNLATHFRDKGNFEEALTHYHKAMDLNPKAPIVYKNIGLTLHLCGKPDEAVPYYRKSLQRDPKQAFVHAELGGILDQLGQTDEAIKHLNTVTRLEPTNTKVHLHLADALNKQGQLDEAIKHYMTTIDLKPDDAQAHGKLGVALAKKGQNQNAIRHYQKAIQLDPDFVDPYHNLANALSKQGQVDEAIELLNRVLQREPSRASAYADLGYLLAPAGRIDEAVQAYHAALRIDPTNAQWYYALGELLNWQNKIDEAVTAYRKALELNPTFDAAQKSLATALAKRNR